MRTLKGSWKVAVAFRGTCEATSAFLTISTDLLPPPVSVMFLSCVISHLAIMLAQLPGTSNNQHAPCSLLAACTALWHLQPVPPWGTCGPGLATSMGTPRERCKVGKRRCKLCRCLLAAGEEGQKLGLKWGGSTCTTEGIWPGLGEHKVLVTAWFSAVVSLFEDRKFQCQLSQTSDDPRGGCTSRLMWLTQWVCMLGGKGENGCCQPCATILSPHYHLLPSPSAAIAEPGAVPAQGVALSLKSLQILHLK